VMPATAADVLANRAAWGCECGDAAAWLGILPDDSVDLLVTSPPYELARTYGLRSRMVGGQAWVDWMVAVVTAAAPKVKGLIAVVCEGQTRGYRYSCAPFLLVADLHRAGFNLRKPPVFHRVGIPGSGGPDWLRNDWEPVVCVTRSGRLPWSDPTAAGGPCRYGVGGAMSNRTADGRRINRAVGQRLTDGRLRNGHKAEPKVLAAAGAELPRGAKLHTKPTANGHRTQLYIPPEKANPGNVIRCDVGGGRMGHDLAHENEAPYPLKLATFFVCSFCPPGGVVADCFAGSGTTCHAAVEAGRRFVGCDVRQSQVDLCRRRMSSVTPALC
jgi:hypothetical protein